MTGYIYLPVPTDEMHDFADSWNEGLDEKGKSRREVLSNPFVRGWRKGAARKLGFGCLARVGASDKLYVLAHGSAGGSRSIGARRGAGADTLKKYTPAELAQVLESEGLTKRFEDLRIFACGSGLAPVDHPEMGSFAYRLREAMLDRGYREIRVTGYLGAVRSSYAHRLHNTGDRSDEYTDGKHKAVELVSGRSVSLVRAKEAKVVYSGALDGDDLIDVSSQTSSLGSM